MNKFKLLKYEELPEYMKDNEYILNYYRADWSLKHAFISLFLCHNETLNVWTHLIGFATFLVLTIANLTHLYEVADFLQISKWVFPSDNFTNVSHQLISSYMGPTPQLIDITRWPIYVYLSGAMFCFFASSLCHLFSCHSHHLNCLLSQLDYIGITSLY
ncbi:heptahelical transmembrane protein 1-like isoform X2 [Rutidosis leptorrhynchoides]|uniref:heptahelical transmembrane protein 1-like isoform X2 n=1 Tax=Rutidosis leptorrhynchoides TaxID=125765 RepID=UPI003A99AC7F